MTPEEVSTLRVVTRYDSAGYAADVIIDDKVTNTFGPYPTEEELLRRVALFQKEAKKLGFDVTPPKEERH